MAFSIGARELYVYQEHYEAAFEAAREENGTAITWLQNYQHIKNSFVQKNYKQFSAMPKFSEAIFINGSSWQLNFLMIAAVHNNTFLMRYLTSNLKDRNIINLQDRWGQTALSIAINYSQSPLRKKITCARLLLMQGADPNLPTVSMTKYKAYILSCTSLAGKILLDWERILPCRKNWLINSNYKSLLILFLTYGASCYIPGFGNVGVDTTMDQIVDPRKKHRYRRYINLLTQTKTTVFIQKVKWIYLAANSPNSPFYMKDTTSATIRMNSDCFKLIERALYFSIMEQ